MKRLVFVLYIFVLFAASAQDNSDYIVPTIDDKYQGTYLPLEYVAILQQTKSHSDAISYNKKYAHKYHDILSLEQNIIHSDVAFHDTYAITKEEYSKYIFHDYGKTIVLIDDEQNKYIKVAGNENPYEYELQSFIISVIFKPYNIKGLKHINNEIVILNNRYRLIDDLMFFPKGFNLILYCSETKETLGLVIKGKQYIFYKLGLSDGMDSDYDTIIKSNNIVYSLKYEE